MSDNRTLSNNFNKKIGQYLVSVDKTKELIASAEHVVDMLIECELRDNNYVEVFNFINTLETKNHNTTILKTLTVNRIVK